MIHDQALVDLLSGFKIEPFKGEVFRATGVSADPLAFSLNGGRWAPRAGNGSEVPILYASMERDGALAEVVSYLTLLTPHPLSRPLKVSRLSVSTSKTIRLTRADLETLAIELSRYGIRDYARTQVVGAAIAFLGIDGLVAPSARWKCDNFMIFGSNHSMNESLEVIDHELVEWGAWARQYGFLSP